MHYFWKIAYDCDSVPDQVAFGWLTVNIEPATKKCTLVAVPFDSKFRLVKKSPAKNLEPKTVKLNTKINKKHKKKKHNKI